MPPKYRTESVVNLFCLVCTMLFIVGCGSANKAVDLQGEVSYAGKPIPLGKIVFTPDTSRGNSGPQGFAAIEQGKFNTTVRTGRGSVPGHVIVKIEGFETATAGSDGFLGKPLFEKPYEQAIEINAGQEALTISIPASHK